MEDKDAERPAGSPRSASSDFSEISIDKAVRSDGIYIDKQLYLDLEAKIAAAEQYLELGSVSIHGTTIYPHKDPPLSKTDLLEADLSNAVLKRADFYKADLSESNLKHANLSGANLSGANLSGANLRGANLRDADLTGTLFSVGVSAENSSRVWIDQSEASEQSSQHIALIGVSRQWAIESNDEGPLIVGNVSLEAATVSDRFRLDYRTIFLSAKISLSLENLSTLLFPYLSAIEDIQHVIDEVKGRPFRVLMIESISAGSFKVHFPGVAETIQMIISRIDPESSEYYYNQRRIRNEKAAIELAMAKLRKVEAELQVEGAKLDLKAREAEIAVRLEELRERKQKNDMRQREIDRDVFTVSHKCMEDISPNMSPEDIAYYAANLKGSIGVIRNSPLTIVDRRSPID